MTDGLLLFARLLRGAGRRDLALMSLLLLLASLTEGVGLLLIVPMLVWLTADPMTAGGSSAWLVWLRDAGVPVGLGSLLFAFILVVALRSLVELARDRVQADVQHKLVDRIRARCFAALLDADWRWIVATRRSDHASQLLVDINRVGVAMGFGIGVIVALATILAYLAVAFLISPTMTLFAIASGAVLTVPLAGMRSRAIALGEELSRANRALHATIDEALATIKLSKFYDGQARQLRGLEERAVRLRRQQLQFLEHGGMIRAAFQIGGAILLAGYFYYGLAYRHMPLPEMLTLALVFARLVPMLMNAQRQWHHWLHGMPAARACETLLADCLAAAEPQGDDGALAPPRHGLELDRVSIVHGGARRALDRVSLTLPVDTTTAIVGESGAGKSTLADTLVGLLAPDEGTLRIDGRALTAADRRAWRHQIAYVPQQCVLFHASIRDNLRWAAPDADDARIEDALRRAAADFVLRLPEGLDTIVGDDGCRLSGGERQRLGLARALLRRPSLLVLDEATSALDPDTEARIFEVLRALRGRLTIVVIGHRLPRADFADQWIAMADGRIADGPDPTVGGGR